ncbi:aminotransferase class V-fold PLP-dependent enzyme [Alkalibacterium kapii]|uniref:Aminotransferase n=1 Tax=Alkalibacterium kapii TaxID=426704 RepID=A0A511AVC1_9LACT|nr:aminotransferase class V-fold PLP-dependent enzyme [Alkalibacterium kapii]GEK92148.1 hypothetical protein AKA01nite_17700 [Alkalibacterium kapii]
MQTFPLESISVKEAMLKQFRLVDCITNVFPGNEMLTRGDLGVVPGLNKPETTKNVERVIADFFKAEDCMLVRGSGTMAIRYALYKAVKPGGTLLIHDAPIYPTTKVTLDMFNIGVVKVDFNDQDKLRSLLKKEKIDGALVQLTRQKPNDRYDSQEVIKLMKELQPRLPIVTDDNYAVMKIPKIGVEMGANLSCFSTFKLLGPEGIGCIVGEKELISELKKDNYSGGLQVQGHEALDVLRGLTYAPVSLAISAETTQDICDDLNQNAVKGVKRAMIANAQSKVLLIELNDPIAKEVLKEARQLGAAPYPVGAESKYEIVPMFYRVSHTFLESDPSLEDRMIRINPMRSGPETVKRLLSEAIQNVIKDKGKSRNE